MTALAREISFSQRGSVELTLIVVPSISTDVTRASRGPTTSCQASVVRAADAGCRRRMSASTGVTKVWTDFIGPNLDIINPTARRCAVLSRNTVTPMRLILASGSPRRAELLRLAGFDFQIQPADVVEIPAPGESAADYTLRVARDKAHHIANFPTSAGATILAADTEVIADRRILGKPRDSADAADMLRLLSGTAHEVLTAVVVRAGSREVSEVVTTTVHVTLLSEEEIR